MDFDENTGYIDKIDTTKILRKNVMDLQEAVVELQVKMNEIIDSINTMMMPDDDFDEEEEDEQVVVKPSQIDLGSGRKTR
jgi:hypothetical protein